MKTNVTLASQSREIFGVTIRQETKTGHLNLSDLQNAYDIARQAHGWSSRTTEDVLATKQNHERIYYILEKNVFGKFSSEVAENQLFIKPGILGFMESIEKEGITKILKQYGAYSTKGARKTKASWCNPYIWVLVAMEMNPMIYGEVITWLTDKLIINRIEAGNFYKDLSRAVYKFPDVDYSALGKSLNFIVFDKHESGIRNTGSEEQLNELFKLESNLAFAIEGGFLNTFPAVMEHLRGIWTKKQREKELVLI